MKTRKILAILCCAMLAVSLTGCFPFNILQNVIGGSDGPTSVIVESEEPESISEDDSEFEFDFEDFSDLDSEEELSEPDYSDLSADLMNATAWYNLDNDDIMWLFTQNQAVLYEDAENYYIASFSKYYNEDAVDYVSSELSEYGLTEEEQLEAMSDLGEGENYFCLVFSDIDVYEDSVYVGEYEEDIIPYIGFEYLDDDTFYHDMIRMDTKDMIYFYSYANSDTDTGYEDTQRIGDEIFGYVDVPSDFMPFTNDVEIEVPNLQYSDITGNNIVTMQYYDGSLADAKTFAQTLSSVLLNDPEVDQESITGATVTLDGMTAYQLYCYYPSYDRYLVTWCFDETNDGYLHYVSVEFNPENYYLFEMVEDTYHVAY